MKRLFVFIVMVAVVTVSGLAQTLQQADSLHQLGREFAEQGKIAEARACDEQAMDIRRKLLGEVSEDYITTLNNYALTFSMEENYVKAAELQEYMMELCAKLHSPHSKLGLFAQNTGYTFYQLGNKEKAIKYWEIALPVTEKFSKNYETLLTGLAMLYDEIGDRQNENRIMALMEEHNQHELTLPCDDPKCMLERAQYYGTTGNQAMAKECYMKALSMPMDDEMKIQVYEAYAQYMTMTVRDMATGAEYQYQAANMRKDSKGKDADYANSIYRAGQYYSFTMTKEGYQKSIECYEKALEVYLQTGSELQVAKCQQMTGNAYSGLREHSKAKECYREALAYYEANDRDSAEYPKTIGHLAAVEKFNKDYEDAIAHYQQAMQIYAQRGMMKEYADAENGLSLCYVYAGIEKPEGDNGKNEEAIKAAQREQLDKLIAEEMEVLELTRNYLGKMAYAQSLGVIASCNAMKEDYAEAVDYYKQYIEVVREAVRDEFRLQSEAERMDTWKEEAKTIAELQELLVKLPEEHKSLEGDIVSLAYDAELLSKGILLNSSIEFEKVLNSQNDKHLTDIYNQTKENRTEIERLRKEASTDADLEKILSLTQENQRLQIELNKGCREMEDFTQYISYSWNDVQSVLADADVSIEFVSLHLGIRDQESHMVALVLTKGMTQPVAVTLWNRDNQRDRRERELLNQDDGLYDSADAGNLVWGRISSYLKDRKRIFFSADGIFNNIGIEYLQYNGKPLSEQFEVYRLSSTKELCYKRERAELSKAALFGDVNYNDEATQRSLASLRSSGDVGGFADLANTLREVNDIQGILKSKGLTDTEKFRDTEASKSAFMSLSGTKVNLLHIATHGMYRNDKKTTDAESMRNSLLAFAGANLNDSALVTAADIATMNLRQCDLAVLSACETGLGKLGGDGVFGLQRGFKNAGVHTLLMSLKNVYDDSTANLMISFYKHLMNGATKREALVKAQQDIRAKGFNDPKYWATFILLDAL